MDTSFIQATSPLQSRNSFRFAGQKWQQWEQVSLFDVACSFICFCFFFPFSLSFLNSFPPSLFSLKNSSTVMIWRCDGRDKSNAFNRALFGYFFKRELLKSFNSLFSQVWRSTKSFQHFVCDCWFYSFYLFFFVPSSKLFPYLVHLIRCSFSSPTFLLGPLSMKAERTELMRPVEFVASTFNPAAAGAGWWKIQRDRHRERFPLCSVMNVPPTRSLIYIYSRLGLYIYSLWCVCVYIYTGILLNIGTSNQQRNYESCFSFFFFVPTAEECFSIFFFRNLVRFLLLFCFF